MKALVDGNNAFALDLYKKLAEKTDGNVIVSPYSISSALAMTYAGARGQTAEEMAKVLGLTGLGDRVHPAHAALSNELQGVGGKGGPEFHIANALWGQRGLPFRDEFLRLTRDHYATGLREVDFAADLDGSRRAINRWVGEQTHGKIPELVKPSHFGPDCKLVLTNAVYFKADWAMPFAKEVTREGPFHLSGSKTVTVPLMRQTAQVRYAEGDSARVVELPYSGGPFSMVVILPAEPGDMGRVEGSLAGGALGRWLAAATPREVELTLPQFRGRGSFALGHTLAELGMPTLFSDDSDLSGMSDAVRIDLNRVVHEAWIEVDEKGTEAAAATAVGVAGSASLPVEYRVDRPFLVLIRHLNTGCLLFAARVSEPSASQ